MHLELITKWQEKDLSESVILSAKILNILGGSQPAGFSYELFLDGNGQKIIKI